MGRSILVGFAMLLGSALSLDAKTFYVTIAGMGGEPDYEQRFALLAAETEKTLKAHAPDAQVETLKGPSANKADVRAALERVAREAKPQDAFVLLLIGHGTFDREYKINLPGPDMTAAEACRAAEQDFSGPPVGGEYNQCQRRRQ